MLEDMLRNVKPLPGQTFGPIAADINALARIVQGGQALAYSLGNLMLCSGGTYPGYGYNANAYYTNYRSGRKRRWIPRLAHCAPPASKGNSSRVNSRFSIRFGVWLKLLMDGCRRIQVLGQINEQQVQQLMKLRELMMADMSSKQAYQATVIQREAAGEAASEKFFTFRPNMPDGMTYKSGWR